MEAYQIVRKADKKKVHRRNKFEISEYLQEMHAKKAMMDVVWQEWPFLVMGEDEETKKGTLNII